MRGLGYGQGAVGSTAKGGERELRSEEFSRRVDVKEWEGEKSFSLCAHGAARKPAS